MRPRTILLSLLGGAVAVLILLAVLDGILVDLLWFGSIGYRNVFVTRVIASVSIFIAVWLLTFAVLFASGMVALRGSEERLVLRVVRRADEIVEVNLPELFRSLGDRIPWRTLIAAGSAVLGLFVAQGEASGWETYLSAIYGQSFGYADQAFGNDVGYYVFALPLLENLRDLWLTLIFLSAVTAFAIYWARGALDFRESPPRVAPAAAAHFSVLLAFFFLQRAMSYWLARYALLFHSNGVVFGLRYVDDLLWRPGLWLLVALSVVAAAICIANYRARGLRLPVIAAALVFGPALLLNLIQPAIERLLVKPNELQVERPYLERNIAMTRRAYKIDHFEVKPFSGEGTLSMASVTDDKATIDNIRVWDPRPLLATYKQLQEIRLYYDIGDVDIDRYWIEGKYTQVMLGAREMNIDRLATDAQTWVNRYLKFTHGYGVAMSPVNAKDQEGMPVFYVKDIPPVSNVGVNIKRPGIYFGEKPDSYVIVDSGTPEFDYPRGTDNVFAYYQAPSGIAAAGLLRRLIFGFYYRDINLVVTGNIKQSSRILIRRNIIGRLNELAPFLHFDHDPYIVTHNGGLYWIVDAYTTSDRFPYSQASGDRFNYIRNSVKAVINAYTGETNLYLADPNDPIIKTWGRIFAGLLKPLGEMPQELRAHIRYPEDIFLVQADMYRTYHMTDPQVFYNREDLWAFPRENYAGETVRMEPYYVNMRLPGESKTEFLLMLPMVPQNRDNMISWLAARCDGDEYGELIEYSFSKDRLFYGPFQIEARINQNPEISRQISLWNQEGSRVLMGNLLVIPVQDSLLYVKPLYLRAEKGELPQLQRILMAYRDRTVMAESIELALEALFASRIPEKPVVVRPGAGAPPSTEAMAGMPPAAGAAAAAASHYQRALEALRAGDWSAFGSEMQKLGQELGKPKEPVPK
jgi:uncharacterized membrane protein (UPF0182 family)